MRMRSRGPVVVRLVAAAALALGGSALTGQAPALAAACSGTSGVTVVVDFGSSVVTRCAPGDPSSGLAALSAAGFSITQVQRFPGAVCRIDGSPSADPCVNMPPANAYWAYFHAQRGGSWSYSQQGAGGYNPAPGSVEGWSFGSGSAPDAAPPAASASPRPSTPSRATSSPRPRPSSTSPRSTGQTHPAAGAAVAPGTSSAASSSSAPATAQASTTAGSGATPGTSAPTTSGTTSPADGAAPSAQAAPARTEGGTPQASAGSGAGTLLAGGGLVAVLGGAAAYLAWRRRTTG